MKKLLSVAVIAIGVMLNAQQVLASVCTLNGEVVPCDQMPKWPFVFMVVFFVVAMLFLAFWIWMIVDVTKYEKEDTAVWVLVVVLLQVLGAVIYYFARRRPRLKEQKKVVNTNSQTENNTDESGANEEKSKDESKENNKE